jgi:hypothetical protein
MHAWYVNKAPNARHAALEALPGGLDLKVLVYILNSCLTQPTMPEANVLINILAYKTPCLTKLTLP